MAALTPTMKRLQVDAAALTPMSTGSHGRKRTPLGTPPSVLTPNDDAAEKAEVRRRRRADSLRRSLADTFAAGSGAAGSNAPPAPAAGLLTEAELEGILEVSLRLAAENKISDRNVWALPLIDALPELIRHEQALSAAGGFNFQKMSGGLDAGVQIYSKRVDQTWKAAFCSLRDLKPSGGGDGDGEDDDDDDNGGEGGDGGEGDESGAAAAAAKRRRQARAADETREADTLAEPEALRVKTGALDATLDADPLFHRMSALFDEGGARGMLLLNRGVVDGYSIMFDSAGVPEAAFDLPDHLQQPSGAADAAAEDDGDVDLTALLPALRTALARPLGAPITPSIGGLFELLRGSGGGHGDAAAAAAADDEAAVRDAVALVNAAAASTSIRGGGGPASMSLGERSSSAAASADAPAAELDAACLAASYGVVGACDDDYDDGGGWGGDDDGGGGLDSDDETGGGGGPSESGGMFGMGGGGGGASANGGAASSSLLDDDAMQWLLGGGGGADGGASARPRGGVTHGAGWAGPSFWRFRPAAAGQLEAPGKRGAAAMAATQAKRAARRAADEAVDFDRLPPLPADAFAKGSRRQTCLVTAPAGPAASLLPEDVRFQAASLARFFLKPGAVPSAWRQRGGGVGGVSAAGVAESGFGAVAAAATSHDDWAGDGGDDGGDCADGDDYGDDDGGDDAEQHASPPRASFGCEGNGGWLDSERDLLQAPHRVAALGVNYSRSAKHVDVGALKSTIWRNLLATVAARARGGGEASADAGPSSAAAADNTNNDKNDSVSFQDVIGLVPEASGAGRAADLSVHMCFICLLHLANERGLAVKGSADLASLTISSVPTE